MQFSAPGLTPKLDTQLHEAPNTNSSFPTAIDSEEN